MSGVCAHGCDRERLASRRLAKHNVLRAVKLSKRRLKQFAKVWDDASIMVTCNVCEIENGRGALAAVRNAAIECVAEGSEHYALAD